MADVMAKTNLRKRLAHAQKMESVSAFIRDANLPQEYLKDVLAFFRKQKYEGYDQQQILMELPYNLRRKMLCTSTVTSSIRCRSSTSTADDGENDHVFVTELCSRMRRCRSSTSRSIYQMGEIGRHMFILAVGRVEVLDKNLETGRDVPVLAPDWRVLRRGMRPRRRQKPRKPSRAGSRRGVPAVTRTTSTSSWTRTRICKAPLPRRISSAKRSSSDSSSAHPKLNPSSLVSGRSCPLEMSKQSRPTSGGPVSDEDEPETRLARQDGAKHPGESEESRAETS